LEDTGEKYVLLIYLVPFYRKCGLCTVVFGALH